MYVFYDGDGQTLPLVVVCYLVFFCRDSKDSGKQTLLLGGGQGKGANFKPKGGKEG